jgi:hypothetical protein
MYHNNWAHLNGIIHKFLQSACVYVRVSLVLFQDNGSVKCIRQYGARERLDKHVQRQRIYETIEELLDV